MPLEPSCYQVPNDDSPSLAIDQNETIVHIASPYDREIIILNKKLNDTYIYYGNLKDFGIISSRYQIQLGLRYIFGG